MRTVVYFIIAAVLAVALGWAVSGLPGTVSATIGDTVLETSVPVALALVAAAIVVLLVVLRILAWVLGTPRRVGNWQRFRQRNQGDAAVHRTLLALATGDSGAATRDADRSRKLLGDGPLTLLLAAQAARQAGRDTEADALFRTMAGRKDAAFLGLRGLLRQAMAAEDWKTAAELAQRAEAAQPGAAWLRGERAQIAIRTGQWRDALRLTPPDAPKAAFAAAAAQAEQNPAEAMRLAKQGWTADPALTPAALAYAGALRDVGKEKAALEVLRKSWALAPHPDLAAFTLAKYPGVPARLEAAMSLVSHAPDTAEAHLLVGREALDAGRLPEARRHADQARAAGMNQRRLYLLLADLAETEGDRDAARDALRYAAVAEPDPVWQCQACGTVHHAWHPVCDACGTPGRITWTASLVRSGEIVDVGTSRILPRERDGARLTHVKDIEQLP